MEKCWLTSFKTLFIFLYYWYYNWIILKLVFVLKLFLWVKKNKINSIDIPQITVCLKVVYGACWWQHQALFCSWHKDGVLLTHMEVSFTILPSLVYSLQVGMRKAMTVLKMGWRPGLVIFPQQPSNQMYSSQHAVLCLIQTYRHITCFYSAVFEIGMNALDCLYSCNCSQDWLYPCAFTFVSTRCWC